MDYIFFYEGEIANISIVESNNNIIGLNFLAGENVEIGDRLVKETPLLKEASHQLDQYFKGKLKDFDLPILVEGTDFQKRVWRALQAIPYGETWTYKKVAEQVGSPRGARAVGMANNRNPISIIIPCHRVIGANGRLVGYGGGLHIKERLLSLEAENKENIII